MKRALLLVGCLAMALAACGDLDGPAGRTIEVVVVNDYAESLFTLDASYDGDTERMLDEERLARGRRATGEAYFEPFEVGDTVELVLQATSLGETRTFEIDVEWEYRTRRYEMRYSYDLATARFIVRHGW